MSHQEKKRKHINSFQSLNDAIHWSPSTIGGEQVADARCKRKKELSPKETILVMKPKPVYRKEKLDPI
ncbi:hypothetical protein TNCV_485481 [Trichonephila clavipes]|nr:hypothetical protein TNCV_485481 [Trichonephila clavipes]